MRVLAIRNVPFEGLGVWEDYFKKKRVFFSYWDVFKGLPRPEIGFTHVIVLGGPMGVYEVDVYPHLRREMRFLEREIEKGTPILGVCLGCQILAHLLGAKVYKGLLGKEIGWCRFYAKRTDIFGGKGEFIAFQWHGDTFDIPKGADPVGRTDLYENQGFVWNGKVVGLQFHPEVTKEYVLRWCREYRDDLKDAGVERDSVVGSDELYAELARVAFSVINYFLSL